MQFLLRSVILLSIVSSAAAATSEGDFYVSPAGKDQWSGKLAAPNALLTDGPFATVQRAQEAARQVHAADAAKPVTIVLRAGVYSLVEPLAFTPADSNTAFVAFGDEKPLITGGVVLTGWKVENGRWTLQIPDVQSGKWSFSQLWVNGQRRYRPRLPKNGYYQIAAKLDPTEKNKGKGSDRFQYANNDINANWSNRDDIEVIIFQVWTMARMRIADVNTAEKIVNFTGHSRSIAPYSVFEKNHRFFAENVKDALSEPGEWYLDRKTGVLTYIPMPGESLNKAEIIAPRADSLVQIQGDISGRKWVSNLTFRGLTFAYSNWNCPPEGNNFAQAEVNLPGTILANGAEKCVFENCIVKGAGVYAIEFATACKNNRVEGCQLIDAAAGGVKIGLQRNETNEELITSHNTVRDCLIAHGGRMHPAAHGVWIGHSPYNTVEHNDIFDFYYTGVSVGWSWGYRECGSHHNTIAYNHIHHFGQGVLSDMGGIYTLGLAEGTVLHHNLIHDVYAFDYGGWGIYFDEGTTHETAEDNIVYRTKTGGFHQHYGKENTVRNNIFAFAIKDQLQRTRTEPHQSFTFDHNIVYWNAGPLLGSNWRDNNYKLDYNLYWRTDKQPVDFFKRTLQQWQDLGQDKNSLIADPLFVKPEKGDFTLKPGSPAEKTGFKPIDMSKVGRLTKFGQQDDGLEPPAFPVIVPEKWN